MIDWQWPQSATDKKNYVKLFYEIDKQFSDTKYTVGVTVSSQKQAIDNHYDIHGFKDYVDIIHVLTYDLHGAWEATTHITSPLKEDVRINIWKIGNFI